MGLLARAAWAAERVVYAISSAGERVVRAARPKTSEIKQLQSWNSTVWKVDAIQNALEFHERGDFIESARLAEAFGRDDRITACTNTRIRALVGRNGVNLQITASTEGDQRSTGRFQRLVEERFPKVCTEAVLSRIQHDAIHIGVAICRIVWTFHRVDREWLPTLVPWDLEWVRWDEQRGCYVTQTITGEVEIRPNTGEWLIVEPAGARGYRAGAVRALAMGFFFRTATWQDWARYCEKHGVPILVIEEPPASTDSTSKATKDGFFAGLRRMGREGILRLPRSADGKSGYGANILEPKTLSYPAFQKFLERLDVCIAVFLLGQNLSTEVTGGSFAAAIAQNRIRLDYLAADAEALTTALREQLWMWWGRFNFDGWDDAVCPWAVWTTSVPEDLKTKADMLAQLGKALAPLIKGGMPIDIRKLADQYGVPILSVQDALKQAEEDAAKAAALGPPTPPPNSPPAAEKAEATPAERAAKLMAAVLSDISEAESLGRPLTDDQINELAARYGVPAPQRETK